MCFSMQDLLKKCASPLTSSQSDDIEMVQLQMTSFRQVMRELVREITSPNRLVREQVTKYGTFYTANMT